jgi:NitT/TauT family transport system substrate-binding protein
MSEADSDLETTTMRKWYIVVMLIAVCIAAVTGQAAQEAISADQLTVRMAVMQGPSGFGTVALMKNDGRLDDRTSIDVAVYPSPNEVIARLANGELDFAALPTNVAANLFAKGVGVKTAAITGEGMLLLLTTDASITEFSDLANRKISIPGAGSTPDQMTRIMTTALGYDYEQDVNLDYSIASPAQLAQMLIAEKVDLAVLPEPFVSMVMTRSEKAIPLLDIQMLWYALTGIENYPMTVIVVSDAFVEEQSDRLPLVMDAIEDSIEWVVANPEEAGSMIEEAGIMKAAIAVPAIPRLNLVFKTANEGFDSMDMYLKVLYGFDSSSIGGSVPDESFYLAY